MWKEMKITNRHEQFSMVWRLLYNFNFLNYLWNMSWDVNNFDICLHGILHGKSLPATVDWLDGRLIIKCPNFHSYLISWSAAISNIEIPANIIKSKAIALFLFSDKRFSHILRKKSYAWNKTALKHDNFDLISSTIVNQGFCFGSLFGMIAYEKQDTFDTETLTKRS